VGGRFSSFVFNVAIPDVSAIVVFNHNDVDW
jgi:hypothetical protein